MPNHPTLPGIPFKLKQYWGRTQKTRVCLSLMKPQELKCKAASSVQCLLYSEKSTCAICSYIYPAETLK